MSEPDVVVARNGTGQEIGGRESPDDLDPGRVGLEGSKDHVGVAGGDQRPDGGDVLRPTAARDHQPGVAGKSRERVQQRLQALVRLDVAEEGVDVGIGWDPVRSARLHPAQLRRMRPDEMPVRDDEQAIRPPERLAHRVGGRVAVRDDRRCDAAELDAEGVVDVPVGPVVRIHVVRGPDHAVTELAGQPEPLHEGVHLAFGGVAIGVGVLVVRPVEVEYVDRTGLLAQELLVVALLEGDLEAAALQGIDQERSVRIRLGQRPGRAVTVVVGDPERRGDGHRPRIVARLGGRRAPSESRARGAALPCHAAPMSETTVPIVRWGIVGPGDIADRVMAPAMRDAPLAELVSVWRRDRGAAEAFAARHGASRVHASLEDLAADPDLDAIYIATPVHRHADDVSAVARPGRDILCEKPLARTVDEAVRLRDAADAAGARLWTCFYQRYNARHLEIARMIRDGAIGRVTSVQVGHSGRSPDRAGAWRQDAELAGGGSFIDAAVHAVDLLRFLFGPIEGVAAMVDTLAAKHAVEDTATALLRLSGGVQAVVSAHWSVEDPSEARASGLLIGGTGGTIAYGPINDKFSRGTLTVATNPRATEAVAASESRSPQSTHVALLEDIASRRAAGLPPAVSGDDGVAAQRVIAAVYEAARTGQTIHLDPPA